MDKNTKRQIDVINQRIKELGAVYRMAAVKSGGSDSEVYIWSILLNSESEDEYSKYDLCELLSLPKQTINSIVSNLIKKGFVFLEHVPGTRNRKVIRLTKEGLAYGTEKIMWIFRAEEKTLEQTDPVQVQTCIELTEKFITLLKKEIGVE